MLNKTTIWNKHNELLSRRYNEDLFLTIPKAIVNEKNRSYNSNIVSTIDNKKSKEYTINHKDIINVLKYLKTHGTLQYKQLLEIVGVDYPNKKDRFQLNYLLLSNRYNKRLVLKMNFDEITPIETSTGIFKSAGWYEREVWDLFGIYFTNHPDLRRILTDYGFQGHPLRKDFPLIGYEELRYDNVIKNIIAEPVEMTQKFRFFNFNSPWVK